MKSKWHNLKPDAISLRQSGVSLTSIEKQLGIPRSTLSGWLRSIVLTPEQRWKLDHRPTWTPESRAKAHQWHRDQKAKRLLEAQDHAKRVLQNIMITDEVLDLALAMLYWGEGTKSSATSLASSDPRILKFMLYVLRRNYAVLPSKLRFELHLRMDQNPDSIMLYWSNELEAPLDCFKTISFDKRTLGRPTYPYYKGVCVVQCGRVDIQRKLVYLYNLFCDNLVKTNMGV